jgi:hypothetical protein
MTDAEPRAYVSPSRLSPVKPCVGQGRVGLESARESVHVLVGDPLRVRTAQVAEHPGPAELGGDVSVPGHDVKVQVSEALGFGEQDRVGLGAAHGVDEGSGEPLLEDPEACSFDVGELGQAGEMPDGEQDEPAEQCAVESVRNLPPTVGVDAITRRQVTAVGELAGVTARGHEPIGRDSLMDRSKGSDGCATHRS